jgi:hypothetical protein
MGATNGKGSGKGRVGGWEPLGARVERLEAKVAAMESRRAKEEAEQEKAEMLAVATAKAKEEAANLLAIAGGGQLADQHSLRRPRSRSTPRHPIRDASSDNDEGTGNTTKTNVVAASDLSDLFRAVGMTRRVPKGVWTAEKLIDAILTHADFDRKMCVTQSKQLVEGTPPRDNQQLVKVVLKAYGA